MIVYLIMNRSWNDEVVGVYSSEEKAREWLENKAVQEWGWTPGEARAAAIEPWPVDAD